MLELFLKKKEYHKEFVEKSEITKPFTTILGQHFFMLKSLTSHIFSTNGKKVQANHTNTQKHEKQKCQIKQQAQKRYEQSK